jgi:AraC family transcriptional regulator, transcriptional activator of pobA
LWQGLLFLHCPDTRCFINSAIIFVPMKKTSRKKGNSIPVNAMGDEGISVERVSFKSLPGTGAALQAAIHDANESHRHRGHSFFLLETGIVSIEIDFKKYKIKAPSIMYVHPDQVHRTRVSVGTTVSSLTLGDENLNPDHLKLLADITPAIPILLNKEMFSLVSDSVEVCMKFSEMKGNKLYHSLLKDSSNALVALIISQYLERAKPANQLSRVDIITKAFRKMVERNYTISKRPAEYARNLNLSAPYLNECVRNATGYPVSWHIQQRVILEAKRLLSHSDKSVKEIAADLGYDDYPYFSRLFSKVTHMSPLTFRTKNLE